MGLISQVPILKFGVPDEGYKSFILQEKLWVLSSLLTVGCCAKDEVYGKIVSQLSLPNSVWIPSHLPDVNGSLHKFLGIFFLFFFPKGNYSLHSYRFSVSMGVN